MKRLFLVDSREKHNIWLASLFITFSFVNVRVGARVLEYPSHCGSQAGCAALVVKQSQAFETDKWQIKTAPGTSFIKMSGVDVELVRGVMMVSAKAPVTVHTLYGDIRLTDGKVLLEAADSVVSFTNLSSDMKYQPRGEKQTHVLPKGFGTYFSNITTSGVAETGYPHPAEVDSLIKSWAKVYPQREKSLFHDEMRVFLLSWKQATEAVGPWYVETVKREIAEQEAEAARLAQLRAKREEEGMKWRKLFRARNLMNYQPGPTHDVDGDREPASDPADDM